MMVMHNNIMFIRIYIYIVCVRVPPPLRLKAFPVDDGRTALVVLGLGDPHLLESGQGRQDGSADPHGVLALGRRDRFDLHGGRRQWRDLLLHPVGNARVHGGAAGQHGVGVQVLPDVHVALHDRVVRGLVDAGRLHSQERRLEQRLGTTEPFVSDGDHLRPTAYDGNNVYEIRPVARSLRRPRPLGVEGGEVKLFTYTAWVMDGW